jgi:hypothetical protein
VAAVLETRRVRHLMAWIADHDQSKARGWKSGNHRPICGSTAEFNYPTNRALWGPETSSPAGRRVKARTERPVCRACVRALAELNRLADQQGFTDG